MSIYKITNITDTLPKRDSKNNSKVIVSYVNNMMREEIEVKPKDIIYLTIQQLPLSIHRLRMKNLITVVEVHESDLPDLQKGYQQKEITPSVKKQTPTEKGNRNSRKKADKKID